MRRKRFRSSWGPNVDNPSVGYKLLLDNINQYKASPSVHSSCQEKLHALDATSRFIGSQTKVAPVSFGKSHLSIITTIAVPFVVGSRQGSTKVD